MEDVAGRESIWVIREDLDADHAAQAVNATDEADHQAGRSTRRVRERSDDLE